MQKLLLVLGVVLGVVLLALFGARLFLSTSPEVVEERFVDLEVVVPPTLPAQRLSEFITTPPSPAQEVLRQEILDDEYYVRDCEDLPGTQALVLVGQYRPIDGLNSFAGATEAMRSFENDVYRDWGQTLYGTGYTPSSQEPQVRINRITDGHVAADEYIELLHADVRRSVYYGWTLNYLVAAPTPDCLIEAMESVYHVH